MTALYYLPEEQYIQVECDLMDEAGELLFPTFWIEVRKNLTIGERAAMIDRLAGIADRVDQYNDQVMERHDELTGQLEQAKADGDERRVRELGRQTAELIADQRVQLERFTGERRAVVAPYVRSWSLGERLPDGTVRPAPAPQDAGAAAFEDVPLPLTNWIVNTCQNAYRLGKPLGTTTKSGDAQVPGPEPTNAGPQVIAMSPTRRSRKKS